MGTLIKRVTVDLCGLLQLDLLEQSGDKAKLNNIFAL